jgi:hypothetical protein
MVTDRLLAVFRDYDPALAWERAYFNRLLADPLCQLI